MAEEEKAKEIETEEHDEEKAEQLEVEKDVITEIPTEEEVEQEPVVKLSFDIDKWEPKTTTGKKVKKGELTKISEILDKGEKIVEPEVTEILLPNMESELLMIGQSKGKFGGGSRRVFSQTQKKTTEGNKPSFATMAVVGNKDGYVGLGSGKSKDTVPAREKATRNAKLNVFKIRRGCGSWQCNCKTPHSIPFTVEGKCGSVKIKLMPAPKGKGLVVEKECAKLLKLAGIKDVWSKAHGQTGVKKNLIKACELALKKLMETKITQKALAETGLKDGAENE